MSCATMTTSHTENDPSTHDATPRYIASVFVSSLFGRYTYEFPADKHNSDIAQLLLLYGDNGCGKTTILKTIFNLLTTQREGIRTEIAQTPFKKFQVQFNDETTITAEKDDKNELRGSYQLTIASHGNEQFSWHVDVDERGNASAELNPELHEYISKLQDLDIHVLFLPDDRKIRGVFDDEIDDESAFVELSKFSDDWRRMKIRARRGSDHQRNFYLDATIAARRLNRWIQDTALKASTTGDSNANEIYLDLLQRVSEGAQEPSFGNNGNRQKLLEEVSELSQKTETYVNYGLISGFPAERITEIISNASDSALSTISFIIEPYINSMTARLRALKDLERTIRTFLETLSSFYVDKNVYFHVRDGLYVHSDEGDSIELNWLSSGERQLLTMLANTIMAKDMPTIFIIDEPEISLNVKWQRTLLDALISLTQDSDVQFLMATHSIELLSQHKEKVVKLQAR